VGTLPVLGPTDRCDYPAGSDAMHSLLCEEAHKLAGVWTVAIKLAGGLEKSTKPSGCRELADGALGDEDH